MKIRRCQIRNFRGLSDIELNFEKPTCLIAGPNAIGKSTVLEAIRLARSILLSRYPSEGQAVLHALGAAQNPNQMMLRGGYFDFSSLARDPAATIRIHLAMQLSEEELATLNRSRQRLSLDLLRGSLGTQIQQDQTALTQYLSSAEGRQKHAEVGGEISRYLGTLDTFEPLPIGLEITPQGDIRGEDALAQITCGFLERSLPPQDGLFSYFSADRALPAGEAAIQLGSGDADNQIKSHIAEPQIKFQRLKHSIANSTLLQQDVEADFNAIFDEILPGKQLAGLKIGPIGNFRVDISEAGVARPFDIDSLSSGEKGLILTFLLIRRTVARGGIVLIDEPELHLNPGVCRKLLDFLIDHCIAPNDLQAVICTHSAEILNSAYERSDCDIHHLKAPDNATPIYRGDFDEMFRALGRLGVSPAESFFYESRIFVEGPSDEELLEEGFRATIGDRCQITSLGGRKAIEAEIRNLQKAERAGQLDRLHCFIFDRDRDVTSLPSTELVRVLQWGRYCFENYLLNVQALYDALSGAAKDPLPDRGAFQTRVRELAIDQIRPLVARSAFEQVRPPTPSLAKEDLRDSYGETADVLSQKLEDLAAQLKTLNPLQWRAQYLACLRSAHDEREREWETAWQRECNGKRLIEALCREYTVNRDRQELKRELVRKIREQKTSEWQTVEQLLTEALAKQ